MSRPDEGLIHQWLDGECTPDEAARIERLVATDAEWAAAVAEARGLIAASSRILGALDAMPHAMPQGSTAAPPDVPRVGASAPQTPRRLRLPAWAGIAAGLVLVVGTAYVLREQSTAPFQPAATSASTPAAIPAAPAVAPAAGGAQEAPGADSRVVLSTESVTVTTDPRAIVPPATVPALTPAPMAIAPPPSTAGAGAAVEVARAERDEARKRAAETTAEAERARGLEARRVAVAPRDAVVRQAELAPAPAATEVVLPKLDGCWRVSAPPEQAGLLVSPTILRANGDTLVLVTPRGNVTVTRAGDDLRGEVQATREACRTP